MPPLWTQCYWKFDTFDKLLFSVLLSFIAYTRTVMKWNKEPLNGAECLKNSKYFVSTHLFIVSYRTKEAGARCLTLFLWFYEVCTAAMWHCGNAVRFSNRAQFKNLDRKYVIIHCTVQKLPYTKVNSIAYFVIRNHPYYSCLKLKSWLLEYPPPPHH